MAVGRVGGGKGRAGGAKGPSGGAGVGKASGGGFAGKVDRSESLVGVSDVVGSGNVEGADPVSARALEIRKELAAGQLADREEATRKLVAEVLEERLRLKSKSLTAQIAEALKEDPRLHQTLERLWSHE